MLPETKISRDKTVISDTVTHNNADIPCCDEKIKIKFQIKITP